MYFGSFLAYGLSPKLALKSLGSNSKAPNRLRSSAKRRRGMFG